RRHKSPYGEQDRQRSEAAVLRVARDGVRPYRTRKNDRELRCERAHRGAERSALSCCVACDLIEREDTNERRDESKQRKSDDAPPAETKRQQCRSHGLRAGGSFSR